MIKLKDLLSELQVTGVKIPHKTWIDLWNKLYKYHMKMGLDEEFNALVDDYLVAHGFGFNGLDNWYKTGLSNDINGFYRLLQKIDKEGLNINEIQVTKPTKYRVGQHFEHKLNYIKYKVLKAVPFDEAVKDENFTHYDLFGGTAKSYAEKQTWYLTTNIENNKIKVWKSEKNLDTNWRVIS